MQLQYERMLQTGYSAAFMERPTHGAGPGHMRSLILSGGIGLMLSLNRTLRENRQRDT